MNEHEMIPAQLGGYKKELSYDFDEAVTNRIIKQLEKHDRKAGWPPQIANKCSATIEPIRVEAEPDSKIYFHVTKLVLAEKLFQLSAGERFIHYGTHLLDRNDYKLYQDEDDVMSKAHFHILFFSYSHNKVIEAFTTTNEVLVIRDNVDMHLPEIAREIEHAIEIASCDKHLARLVEGMKADAMLEPVLTKDHLSNGNRVYRVMYSEPYNAHRESPLLYTARVDLNRLEVIDRDTCNCGEPDQQKADPKSNPMVAVGISHGEQTVSQSQDKSTSQKKRDQSNKSKKS